MDEKKTHLMTTAEVAEWLRVKVNTLEHWRSRGRGPAFRKVGGVVRYRRSDVENWLEEGGSADGSRQA